MNLGASGTAAYVSTTELTVTVIVSPTSLGALTAIVTNANGTSSPAVQTGFVVTASAPTITMSSSTLTLPATTLVINGTNFAPDVAGNTVVLSSGTCHVTAASTTSLTITFDSQPSAGTLTATDTTTCGGASSAVEVANVVAPVTTLWHDTFTDADGTALTSHTPDVGSGGYAAAVGTFHIESNALAIATVDGSNAANATFNPGSAASTFSIDFVLHDGINTTVIYAYNDAFALPHIEYVSGTSWLVKAGANSSPVSLSVGVTYTLVVSVNGGNITATCNGVSVSTPIVSLSTTWQILVYTFNVTSVTFDNLRVTTP
jgi:hypothetical protein